jgi:hypothetical protein
MAMPTQEQLLAFLQDAVTLSNFYVPITLVRFDERTNRIVVLASKSDDDELQIEILPSGRRLRK